MTIITSIYGQKYLAYLLSLLDSVQNVGIQNIAIVHGNIEGIEKLYKIFPRINILLIEYKKIDEYLDRINQVANKLECWLKGLMQCSDEHIIFIDADTYFLKNPREVFYNREAFFNNDFDIAYPVRYGRWKINTGVLFARDKLSMSNFLKKWYIKTKDILSSKQLIKESIAYHGAVDQMSFYQSVLDCVGLMEFKEIPCSEWNMCGCTNDLNNVGILHLKGCLPLLLKEREYGKKYGDERNPDSCEMMFDIWRESYYKSINKFNEVV